MKSKTKFLVDNETVKKIFLKAGFSDVKNIQPLGAGEFNAVYSVSSNGKNYALKIAPTPNTEILYYEKGMMQSEVYWYEHIRKYTSIAVPEIIYSDFSKKIIPTDYFIMEKIEGEQADKIKLSASEKVDLQNEMAKLAAEMHKVKNDKFGYIQNELYDNWYLAIRSMTISLIESCKAKGYKSPRGEKLLGYIEKYKNILEKVDCRMVNYDVWPANIIAKRCENNILKYWWIDPERSFWGDRIADFVCLDFMNTLSKKNKIIKAYNSVTDSPIIIGRETKIRYAVMCAFMGMIMETEKYNRYTPLNFGWWRNVFAGGLVFFKNGFSILKKDGK